MIEITDDEQFQLGTNVLSIGNKTVISLPVNRHVNQELRKGAIRSSKSTYPRS